MNAVINKQFHYFRTLNFVKNPGKECVLLLVINYNIVTSCIYITINVYHT
jgi:hypothetical protein